MRRRSSGVWWGEGREDEEKGVMCGEEGEEGKDEEWYRVRRRVRWGGGG